MNKKQYIVPQTEIGAVLVHDCMLDLAGYSDGSHTNNAHITPIHKW